jgi:hypothetical protein
VKTGLYDVLYSVLSNLAVILCFVPILLLWRRKLQYQQAYLFTAVYWLANGLMNVPGWLGQSDNHPLVHNITLLYNLLDAPLVLLVFMTAASGTKRKAIRFTLGMFIIFEAIMIAWKGYNLVSSTIIIGAGTFLALLFSILGVVEYLKKIEHDSFENAMVFVYASFLFAYGIFIVIYFFSYLKIADSNAADNYIIYYISLFLSTLLTCLGLWKYAEKPVPQVVPRSGSSS